MWAADVHIGEDRMELIRALGVVAIKYKKATLIRIRTFLPTNDMLLVECMAGCFHAFY